MSSKTRLIFEGDNRTRRAFSEINSSMGKLRGSLSGLATSAKGFAAILGAGILGRAGKDALGFADKVQKLNLRLGASTEFLSEMRFAAEQSGVSFNQFALALQRSQRRIGEAAAGTGEARAALQALGLDAQKLAQLSVDDQFTVLAAALSEVESETERLRLAFKLFDSEGVAVLQLIAGGVGALESLREEARRLGVSLSQDAAEGAAKANDAVNRLGAAVRGVVQVLSQTFAPVIEAVANFLANVVPRAANLAKAAWVGWAGAVASALSRVLNVMASFSERVAEAMRAFSVPGAGGLEAAADRLRAFSNTIGEFGATALGSAQENFRLAVSFKEVGEKAKAAAKPVQDLVNSVRTPDSGVEGVQGNDRLWANLFDQAADDAEPGLTTLQDRIAETLASGAERGARGMLDSFRSVLQELAGELVRSGFLQILTGGGSGGGGGLFGALGGIFGGGKQAGGAVGPGIYRVGETGTETIALNGSGVIYPNRGGNGGGLSLTYNVDARGADPTSEVRIRQALKASQDQTIARIRDLRRRRR